MVGTKFGGAEAFSKFGTAKNWVEFIHKLIELFMPVNWTALEAFTQVKSYLNLLTRPKPTWTWAIRPESRPDENFGPAGLGTQALFTVTRSYYYRISLIIFELVAAFDLNLFELFQTQVWKGSNLCHTLSIVCLFSAHNTNISVYSVCALEYYQMH